MNTEQIIQLEPDYHTQEYQELANSEQKRKALAKVVLRIFKQWRIDTKSQLILLGRLEKSRALLTQYRTGKTPIAATQDDLQRASYLIGIYQLLKSLYPKNPEICQQWITSRNKQLNNLTPLDVMIGEGIPGMQKIYRFLQFQMVH